MSPALPAELLVAPLVAVAGGFDPLHAGHVDHIRRASKLGHRLVVIVSPDRALHAKKGYVFLPLWQRMEILRGLRWVDDVVVSVDDDGTVASTLEQLRPAIFAKGGVLPPG